MDDITTRLDALEASTYRLTRRLRWQRNAALLLLALALLGWPLARTMPQAEEGAASQAALTIVQRLTAIEKRATALEKKLRFMTTFLDTEGRPMVQIAGANFRVVNGTKKTATANGLGNIIVGYNELRSGGVSQCSEDDCTNTRTGSHNVVIGMAHTYAGFGGLVVGWWNTITGAYAVVSGGSLNVALGDYSTVNGGVYNAATGNGSTVTGGVYNLTNGHGSSVSGGLQRSVSGSHDWAAGSLWEDE